MGDDSINQSGDAGETPTQATRPLNKEELIILTMLQRALTTGESIEGLMKVAKEDGLDAEYLLSIAQSTDTP
jgi:hypothetical protein